MMGVLVQGEMLDKPTALKLATAFLKRSPTRACSLWVTRVAGAESDANAAGVAWAASDASAFGIVYGRSNDFDESVYAEEMRWQAGEIRRIVGNPFQEIEAGKTE